MAGAWQFLLAGAALAAYLLALHRENLWTKTIPNNGLLRYLGFFNAERIVLTSPEALHEVLVTKNYSFPKPASLRETAGRFLGLGLILSEGNAHKTQRRNMNPAFAPRQIKALYPLFWDKAREMVEAITADEAKSNNGTIEVVKWASRITLDLIGLAGLGRDFGAIRDEKNELVQTYNIIFQPSHQARMLHLIESFVPAWVLNALPIKLNSDIGQAAGSIRELCRETIAVKQRKLAKKELNDLDILSSAIRTETFTEHELIDQAMTLLAAGHDTTGSAFTWGVYLLARHCDVQDKLRQEIQQRLPPLDAANESLICSVDIDSMPYLQAVCSEVLRFYAPVPQTLREAAHDTTIVGQFIPKGARIIVAPWATNRDPRIWGPDAHIFNPDRWLCEQQDDDEHSGDSNKDYGTRSSGGAYSKYGFLSFLHGTRACIGQGFARAELACLLAVWVGSFEFGLQESALMDEGNLDIKGGLTARPADGLHIKTTKISRRCSH
ncbi:hypothetical protein JX266_000881 [Neoarthrinium moseri]|nr:hypothetical protein JX266_000881 [Neoarthrinium moseri]